MKWIATVATPIVLMALALALIAAWGIWGALLWVALMAAAAAAIIAWGTNLRASDE